MEYNLSIPEIGMRYVLAVLIIIPATMFQIMPLIVLAIAILFTGLIGMCPIKTLLKKGKKELHKS